MGMSPFVDLCTGRGHLGCFRVGLLQVQLPRRLLFKALLRPVLLFLPGRRFRDGWVMQHVHVELLTFKKLPNYFPDGSYSFGFLRGVCGSSCLSSSPAPDVVSPFHPGVLPGARRYLCLIRISQVTNGLERLSRCLFAARVSSLVKYLFVSFAHS